MSLPSAHSSIASAHRPDGRRVRSHGALGARWRHPTHIISLFRIESDIPIGDSHFSLRNTVQMEIPAHEAEYIPSMGNNRNRRDEFDS